MKNKTNISLLVLIFIFSISAYAQEKKIQTAQKIKLPELNVNQKLDRAVMNFTVFLTGGIAYAKSMGKTPEEYGKFIGEVLSPGWNSVKGKGISSFIEGMYTNFESDVNCRWDILNESDNSVTVKMNRYGDAFVKAYAETGVTTEDYDQFIGEMMKTIANYLGFNYTQELKGDWVVFTVSKE